MTRDELLMILWREGLTPTQVDAIMTAADKYATAQARLAIDVLTLHSSC